MDNVIYQLNEIGSALLAVDEERCICVRNRNVDCLRCAHVCASGAIAVDGDHLSISPELCIGCGTCATACPTGALKPTTPDDITLSGNAAHLLAASPDATVVVGCRNAVRHALDDAQAEPDGSRFIEVACLGRIDESFLVEMAARGAKRVVLADGGCKGCTYHRGGELAESVAASASSLLSAFGSHMAIERTTGLPSEALCERTQDSTHAQPASRTQDGARPQDACADAPEDTEKAVPHYAKVKNGTLPQHTPSRRVRLLNCLRHLGIPETDHIDTRLWGQVSIDTDLCSSCLMCTVFCPTGALSHYDDVASGIGISHRPALCMQCRLCEGLCPTGALTVSSSVSYRKFGSKATDVIELRPRSWEPNQPESMFNKSAALLGKGNLRCF